MYHDANIKFCEGGSLAECLDKFQLPTLDPKTGRDEDGKPWPHAEFEAQKATAESIQARPSTVWERTSKWARGRPAIALLGGSVALAQGRQAINADFRKG